MVGGVNTATASSDSTINPPTSYATGPGAKSAVSTTTVTTTTPTVGASTGTATDLTPPVAPNYATNGASTTTDSSTGSGATHATRPYVAPPGSSSKKSTGTAAVTPTPAPAAPPVDTTAQTEPRAADGTVAATNTKLNERDRGPSNLTPMNQGNSKEELRITQAIRKSVIADKGLSFNAKNVKIITIGTKVTLRGPVANEQEKASIASRAKQTPGVTDVDDQLEIKK